MRYQLVLWDFDGTIADTASDVWSSIRYAATRCGACLPYEYMANNVHLSEQIVHIFQHLTPIPDRERLSAFEKDIDEHYCERNSFEYTRLYPGIEDVLKQFHQHGVLNVIVTNKKRQALEKLIYAKQWAEFFDAWITPDSVADKCCGEKLMKKEEMIRSMVERYGIDLSACVMIGDRYSDIVAAYSNHIDSIAVTYGDGEVAMHHQARPTFVVRDPHEIEAIVFETNLFANEQDS